MKNQKSKLLRGKHGEVLFHEIEKLPENLQKIEIKENFFIAGESETHGNDHRIAVLDKDNVELFRDKLERTYIKNSVELEVFCPNEIKHSPRILPPGIWETGKSMEYDYETEELRQVRD